MRKQIKRSIKNNDLEWYSGRGDNSMNGMGIANCIQKWIEVVNTPESGKASGVVFATLTATEKTNAQNIMGYRKTKSDRKDVFFVTDCPIARKLFVGFFTETDATF
jgi:hypothetical protein